MSGAPLGRALDLVFMQFFLGGSLLADVLVYGALAVGLVAVAWLFLPVRPRGEAEGTEPAWLRRGRMAAAIAGLLLPGSFDLVAGRAGLGALQVLACGASYALFRSVTGAGFSAPIVLSDAPNRGYFADVPAGTTYMGDPSLAYLAASVLALLYLSNAVSTLRRLWRARSGQG